MRFCFVGQSLETLGGVQRAVALMSSTLIDRGHSVTLLMDGPKICNNPYGLDLGRVKVEACQAYGPGGSWGKCISKVRLHTGFPKARLRGGRLPSSIVDPKRFKAVRELLGGQHVFDVVVGCDPYHTAIVSQACRGGSALVCGWQHSTYDGYFEHKGRGYYGLGKIYAQCLQDCDLNFVLTEESRRSYLDKTGVDSAVLPNAIRSLGTLSSASGEVLYCGRLDSGSKGADYLPRVIQTLSASGFDGRFIVVGDGPFRSELERWLNEAKITCKVEVIGFVDNVEEYYKTASVLVSTSRWEGFGLSILEAMSHGVPCVAFDNDGPRSLIANGESGFIVPKGDYVKLCKETMKILGGKTLHASMSVAARDVAALYTVDKQVTTFLSALESC